MSSLEFRKGSFVSANIEGTLHKSIVIEKFCKLLIFGKLQFLNKVEVYEIIGRQLYKISFESLFETFAKIFAKTWKVSGVKL